VVRISVRPPASSSEIASPALCYTAGLHPFCNPDARVQMAPNEPYYASL
jgi:hypothetical protein